MKNPLLFSLICRNCNTSSDFALSINSPIPNFGVNQCMQQDGFVYGLCPYCNEQTTFYIAEHDFGTTTSLLLRLGYNVYQTRQGVSLIRYDYSKRTLIFDFYEPFIGVEINEKFCPYDQIFTEDFISIFENNGWIGDFCIINEKYISNYKFSDIKRLKNSNSIWRAGFSLNYKLIQDAFNEIIKKHNIDLSKNDPTQIAFLNEAIDSFFTSYCNLLNEKLYEYLLSKQMRQPIHINADIKDNKNGRKKDGNNQ